MRAKRSKQYKKLVQQFALHHGFREPYQVLVDGELVRDAQRFTMDLQAGLERTLHGHVKIMITQCCIRHLYAHAKEPGMQSAIELAKTFERRRCGHRPDDFAEPLSTLECLSHVVDEKGKSENKHRYVVASQDQTVRRHMRGIAGVPLIYISRSVMIMEPMSSTTAQIGAQAERAKFRSELRKVAGEKRKRDDGERLTGDASKTSANNASVVGKDQTSSHSDESDENSNGGGELDVAGRVDSTKQSAASGGDGQTEEQRRKKRYGVKEPNPLSAKKKKRPTSLAGQGSPKTDGGKPKKKRVRKHPSKTTDEVGLSSAIEG